MKVIIIELPNEVTDEQMERIADEARLKTQEYIDIRHCGREFKIVFGSVFTSL